ncbi:MAG: cyclodeaminase/cyclohydrolase family protein [Lachnospiraceae bacterium]
MLLDMKTTAFLDALSSGAPVPGGGGASAAVGAMGAALGMMVTNLTIGKKKYAAVESEITAIRDKLEQLRDQLAALTDEDAKAFEPLSKAYSLPKEEKELVLESALDVASAVPLKIMETILEVMEQLEVLGQKGSRLAISDVGVGVLFAQAALESASLNVFINTKLMQNRERAESLNHQTMSLIQKGTELQTKIYQDVKDLLYPEGNL